MNIFKRTTTALFATALMATGTVAATTFIMSTPAAAASAGGGNGSGGGGGAGGGGGFGPSDLAMYPPAIEKVVAGGPSHRPRPRRVVSRDIRGCPGDVAGITRSSHGPTHGCGTRG